jgi:hypothetical protein
MEEQIKFIKDYLNGCKAIFNGKNLEDTDKALTRLAEIETELKKLRVADVIKNEVAVCVNCGISTKQWYTAIDGKICLSCSGI